jgi:hypothetical protein
LKGEIKKKNNLIKCQKKIMRIRLKKITYNKLRLKMKVKNNKFFYKNTMNKN